MRYTFLHHLILWLVMLQALSMVLLRPVAAESGAVWTHLLGTDQPDYGTGVTVDTNGNIYITGHTTGRLDDQSNAGYDDAFVAKYDPAGNRQWARLLGTEGIDLAQGVAADGSGNVYITGYTSSDLDEQPYVGGFDAFVAKYDPDGNKLWTRIFGTVGNDEALGVASDHDGNVYIAGYTSGNLDGEINAGGIDAFVVMYDPDGNKLWTRIVGSAYDDIATSVAVDRTGNIVVAGHTFGNLDGQTNTGFADAFLLKYDHTGSKLWTRLLGSSGYDYAREVAIDAEGSIAVTGSTAGNLAGQINAGDTDAFVAKYDPAGNTLWTQLLGTDGMDESWGIALDSTGSIYIAGSTTGNPDGQTNTGGLDAFAAKYDPTGNKQWTRLLGTPGADEAWGIAVDRQTNICITGYTGGNLDGQSNAGANDAFVSKLIATTYIPVALRFTAPGW